MKWKNTDAAGITTIGTILPAREDRTWITSDELIVEAGISYRQLDYWCRSDLLVPMDGATPGSGWVRRFDEPQVNRATAIRALLDAGVSLQTIRQIVDEFTATGTATRGVVTFTLNRHQSGDTAA